MSLLSTLFFKLRLSLKTLPFLLLFLLNLYPSLVFMSLSLSLVFFTSLLFLNRLATNKKIVFKEVNEQLKVVEKKLIEAKKQNTSHRDVLLNLSNQPRAFASSVMS